MSSGSSTPWSSRRTKPAIWLQCSGVTCPSTGQRAWAPFVGALIRSRSGGRGRHGGRRRARGAGAGLDGHLIDEAQVWNVADSIPNGSAAALALIEHLWAAPLRDAIARAGGVASGEWIHPLDLVEIGLAEASELERA